MLARKWRPKNFDELQGQEHVSRALVNAIESGRLHHAYLFTGTRGVGKTTIARILSKCLNCEASGLTSKPCGECGSCVEIDEGRFVDLIEVDAASRTKVDDTRELLENVQYRPTRGRYKVYLIDEVHMLSNSSFNALLKTLEEPPEHVIFLLATTDPQKLPVTVLSRCLQFHLKHMEEQTISKHLAYILQQESIDFETPALELISRSAEGSMRDALSLLDQAIAFGQGKVQEEDIRTMLGTIDHQFMVKLLEALANKDSAEAINAVAEMSHYPVDFADALKELLSRIHQIAIVQSTGVLLDQAAPYVEDFADRMTSDDLQLYYQMGLHARRDLEWAPSPRQGLEMALLRMLAFRLEPSQVIQNSSNQTSLDSEAKKKASLKQSEPAEQQAPVVEAPAQKTEPQLEPKSEQKEEKSAEQKSEELTVNKTEHTQAAASGPEEPPFNPDDYASFSDDEKSEDSLAEEYQVSSQSDPQSQVSENRPQESSQESSQEKSQSKAQTAKKPAQESSSNDQAALASLHSALGLSFSDEADSANTPSAKSGQPTTQQGSGQQAEQQTVKSVEDEQSKTATPNSMQAPEQTQNKFEPEQSDDDFKLQPVQPEPQSKEAVEQAEASEIDPLKAAPLESDLQEMDLEESDLSENDPPATEEAQQWAQQVKKMDLTGTYHQIAQSSTIQWLSDDKIQLTVEPSQDILCTDTAKQAIQKSLSQFFNKPIQVDWQFGEAKVATPAVIWQRAAKAKHRNACETITKHPFAQEIAQKFGAKLDKNSIQYLDV